LPATLEPNAFYAVRVGAGFDLYITNQSGAPQKINTSGTSSFDVFAKNIHSYPRATAKNANGDITSRTFTTPSGDVVLTYNYDDTGTLTSKVLSGAIPSYIATTKTYNYDSSGNMLDPTYS